MRAENPDHPELQLQEYVVLLYADVGTRMVAEGKLKLDKAVQYTTTDRRMTPSARVNDYYANTSQSLSPQAYQWGLEAIGAMSPWNNTGAQSAWDKVTGFGYVTVIDTGIQRTHPDLQENFRPHFSQAFYTSACPGNSLVEVDETGGASNSCPSTDVGHGTHVAGIIAATPSNSIGVSGVCWGCSLIIAKTTENVGYRISNLINGLNHAVIRGSQVANLSAGDPGYLGSSSCALTPSDPFCVAIRFARDRAVIFVASTGNQNLASQPDFPAREADVVSVAATNSAGAVWWNGAGSRPDEEQPGSNLGDVDFVAPGVRVVSTIYESRSWNVTCRDQNTTGLGYDECSGTSMAAPHVSAALMMIRSVNPLASNASVISLLSSTGTNVPKPSGLGGGSYKMPNLVAAVDAAISNGSLWPAFAMVTKNSQSNRFTTMFPQMARASIAGTMLPTLIAPYAPVEYVPDTGASTVSGYSAFPDSTVQPRAYFKVYTKLKTSQTNLKPLYRLSKLQNVGNGKDQCGNFMPVPSKLEPVIHYYTTSKSTRNQLMGSAQCYMYDGIEGYVAPSNLGALQELFQIYNPTLDSFIVVPSSKVAHANGLGFTQNQTSLGWVVPN